jgi:YVTN family beta-propeller protein
MRIHCLTFFVLAALASLGRPIAAQTPSTPLPGMPPVLDPRNVYSETRSGNLAPLVRSFPDRIYVPNSVSNTVDIIDPKTFKIVSSFKVGKQPQHVAPSWDMKTLWVLNDLGDSLTRIDPATGNRGETVPVADPYNMYYTPDGKYAIVVAERLRRLDFRDPATMRLERSVSVPCRGVDHMDFSADGRYLVASCEFSATLVKVDVAEMKVLDTLRLNAANSSPARATTHPEHAFLFNRDGMPQDVKLSPDGKVFFVADMVANGVYVIDAGAFKEIGFIPTGKGAHGLYPSRDAKVLYVSNRGEGSISVIDFASRTVVQTWKIPGKASPDMGGVSSDGQVLWLAGRYDHEVYAIDTRDGHLRARIKTGKGPHGLCVFPQPGRYSLGHTGIFR